MDRRVEKLAMCSMRVGVGGGGGGGFDFEGEVEKEAAVFIPPPTLVYSCWGRSTVVAAIQANFPPPLKYLGGGCLSVQAMVSTNGANVFCSLSSLPLLPQPPRQCLGPSSILDT
jgi:hypothetical protein